MPKKTYELKAGFHAAERGFGGKLIRLEEDRTYETSDPTEQRELEEWNAVKEASKGGKG